MFTWECPTCGKELDVGTQQCPVCHPESVQQPPARPQAPPPAPSAPAPPAAARVEAQAPSTPPPAAARVEPPAPAAPPPVSAQPPETAARPARPPAPAARGGLQPVHVAIVGVVLVVAIGLAVYFARPGLFGSAGLQLEDVPETAQDVLSAGTAAQGELQVTGIRPFYDGEYKTKVRAIVVNHSDGPIETVNLEVQLRPPQASALSAPLASFKIEMKNLGPNESREIETDLTALGTLASLPPWQEVRIDLKAPDEAPPAGNS